MALLKEDVYTALRDELGVDVQAIADDTPLFSSGVIDSFSLVSLILFIEARAGITIEPTDVSLDNLDTVTRIVTFANREV